jgi:rubrerythrin
MELTELVTALVGGGEPRTRVYECRHCGATLVRESDECPYCGPTEVATFELGK